MPLDIYLRKFLAGGVSGCITWAALYPMDTVKSKMQTFKGEGRLSAAQVFKQVYNE